MYDSPQANVGIGRESELLVGLESKPGALAWFLCAEFQYVSLTYVAFANK